MSLLEDYKAHYKLLNGEWPAYIREIDVLSKVLDRKFQRLELRFANQNRIAAVSYLDNTARIGESKIPEDSV